MNKLVDKDPATVLQNVLINGDLKDLNDQERVQYYNKVCDSVGLNPLTKPFDYIRLSGKETLYAKKDATDQLRKIHGVSCRVTSREEVDGLYIVTMGAQDKHGRSDEDVGAVQIAGLRGEAKANAIAKATTKAKRRVTLSICGLGWLDETEVSDIPNVKPVDYTLDKLFPDDEKPEPSEPPQNAIEAPSEPDVSENAETPVVADTERPEAYRLLLPNDIKFHYDNAKDFSVEYDKQLDWMAIDENFAPRDRMSNLKELEKNNLETLDRLQKSWKEKLFKKRIDLNKKLGAEKNGK